MTNNLKAERTLTAKNRLSDERLESLRKWYATYPRWKHDNLSNLEIASMVAEIQHLRSQSLSTQQPMGEVTATMHKSDTETLFSKGWVPKLLGFSSTPLYALHPNQESGE